MADQDEQDEKSWILHHLTKRLIWSREVVAIRRRLTLVKERIRNGHKGAQRWFYTGSSAEGVMMKGSDSDLMYIDNDVIVLCPDQDTNILPVDANKSICIMRDADSRPGYVALELVKLGQIYSRYLNESIVAVDDVHLISSEKYLRYLADKASSAFKFTLNTHGPATTLRSEQSKSGIDKDFVISLPCNNWPKEANEWVSRPRLHGWPGEALRDQIVQGGCHLVPVGDKTSVNTFLQLRMSFATAERKLIHSLTHAQFVVYILLKYFLKQIADELKYIYGDADILSSYIFKTVIFHAVENTPRSLWQAQNTFMCFMLCLKILITWVKAGYCPNYFINSNNMFLGKVQGEHQQKLFRFLTNLHDMKWECLSVGTFIQPPIGVLMHFVMSHSVRYRALERVVPTSKRSELIGDFRIFEETSASTSSSDVLPVTLALLSESNSGKDEFISYFATVHSLSFKGMEIFEKHISATGNKEKYKSLRTCKKFLSPLASVCTSPGLLTLATYYYQTGNYTKTLTMCGHMISSFKVYVGDAMHDIYGYRYENLYCGHAYTLFYKCQKAYVTAMHFNQNASQFCPSMLHKELKLVRKGLFTIPPLPYAVFLSFLCYHEIGNISRRDAALIHLQAVKYDIEQGGKKNWIVHNLLGICYQMVGGTHKALREYRDSLGGQSMQFHNPALERIERLQHSK